MSKVAVVGAGAAGLMVAGFLANDGHEVFVFDGNEKAGKKLYITGKGRCNLTNLCEAEEFLQNVVRGEKFMRSAIYNFTPQDAVDFFESLGLSTKVERGARVFPQSDKSSDVIKVLKEKHCKKVKFCFGEKVECVESVDCSSFDATPADTLSKVEEFREWAQDDNKKSCQPAFILSTKKGRFAFDKVVIATGGKSYVSTGSTGDGYSIAKAFGHKVVEAVPALCAIKLKDGFVKSLQGVSLKNVQLTSVADGKKRSFFGEMLFTDCGISGPIVLTASSFLNRAQNVALSLDFKPALSESQLEARLLRDFEANKNKELKTIFRGLLPKVVAEVFAKAVGLHEEQKIHSVTKEQRAKIVAGLKNFRLCFGGLYGLDAGIVTSGGVELSQINPKTFESKRVQGLYFVGEVLDVDALTGGFNLQCCWSCAKSCADNFLLSQKCQKGAY